jgi:hypothetical protein
MDEVSKILTPKKTPQKFVNFPQYPLEKLQRSKDADRLNPSETTSNVATFQKNPSIGEGGLDIKWNDP